MSKRILFIGLLMISLFVFLRCSTSSIGVVSLATPVANETPTPIPETSREEIRDGRPRIDKAKVTFQREMWKSKNIKDYDYVLDLETMTLGIPPQSIEVSVRNGEPSRVRHYRRPAISRLELIEFAFTIERLFDNLESITNENPGAYVLYDADFGFPLKADYGIKGVFYRYELRKFKLREGKVD